PVIWPGVHRANGRCDGRGAIQETPHPWGHRRVGLADADLPRARCRRTATMPTALITGITGQDGSHLAELLLSKGYTVCGMVRRASTENFQRIEQLRDRLTLIQGDLLDQTSIARVLDQVRPDEV